MDNWYSIWEERRHSAKKSITRLLRRLKAINTKTLNQKATEAHESVFAEINCLECANCCKSIPPMVNETDARRIAKHLGMKTAEFKSHYTREDEDGDTVISSSPCPFLGDENKCDIYDVRPKACKQYPHTGDFEFAKHMKLHKANAFFCPAVYHILLKLEDL